MAQPPIGIDLGTTNSLIAVFEENGPRLISNGLGTALTASAVSLQGDSMVVGVAARDRLVSHPTLTATAFKRSMGTDTLFCLGQRRFRAEELSSLVLRKLKEDAENDLGAPIKDVVVSVPAYFNQAQRQATMAACALAGLTPLRLINEPTAAALAYGLQNRDGESQCLVLDLGGGTFDVSLLKYDAGVMEVKASSGDAFLGGEDFSETLAKCLAEKMGMSWSQLGPGDQAHLRVVSDGLKLRLSQVDSQQVAATVEGEPCDVTVTRRCFERQCETLLQRLLRPIERCFYDNPESIEHLDRVLFVGGATRMPMIRQMVARHLRKMPDMSINPDHAVAMGAAIQAGLLAEDRGLDDVVLTDVSPFSVGISSATKLRDGIVVDGLFSPIIERNTPLPASREQVFATISDNQALLGVDVYQGEAPLVAENMHLGQFDLSVPRNKAGQEAMRVRITYDPSGLIEVEAICESTGKKAGVLIKHGAGFRNEEDIRSKLDEMRKLKLHPREEEVNIALLARLTRLYALAHGTQRGFLQDCLVEFEAVLARQDPAEISKTRNAIEKTLSRVDDCYVS